MRPATTPFYARLDQTLDSFGFAEKARNLCAPAYSDNGRGRPGVDPVVYFKMLMVGFFEDIASERGVAERCSDSISLRAFLGYSLTQATPDHSTLSVIRSRLGEEIYDQIFVLILSALREHGLLTGKNVGIDASVIEANASLKNLVNRNTQEADGEYVQRLAATAGIDPKDADAVRRFDRRRPKKMSNEEWVNPHDPDAKIGPTKAGATDMIYKPEPTVDLDTGAILQAEVRPGDEADQRDLGAHVLQAQVNINRAQGQEEDDLTIKSVTADKGYHALPELKVLQAEGIRTVVPDPVRHRNLDHLDQDQLVALRSARRSTRSRSGKDLWRRRGMHLERSFAPLLDAGGGAADHLARLGQLEQALQSIGRHLQLVAAHAATVRNGDAKTACGPGESLLGLYLSLAGDVHQGMPEHQHEFSVLMGFAPNDIWGPGKILGARVLRLDSARLGKSDYINRLLTIQS